MMYWYGSCTGGMNCSGGLGNSDTSAFQHSIRRAKIKRGGQKEGSGNIHTVVMRSRKVELCSFTSAILHHEDAWRPDVQTLTAVTPSPLSTLTRARSEPAHLWI